MSGTPGEVSLSRVWESELIAPERARSLPPPGGSAEKTISRRRIENARDEIAHRRIPWFVRLNPAGVHFGFVERLGHVLLDAVRRIRLERASLSSRNGCRTARSRAEFDRANILRRRRAPRSSSICRFQRRFSVRQRLTIAARARDISEIATIRARTSSLRFVSWVDVARSVAGQCFCRSALRR